LTNGARVPLSPQGEKLLDFVAMALGIRSPVHETFITVSRDTTSFSVPIQAILANIKENIYLLTLHSQPDLRHIAGLVLC